MKKTRIVCTIGPATESPEMLEKLVDAGMDVARLNFSHGSQSEHGQRIKDLRDIAGRLGRPIAVLQDLAGPKIRVGAIANGPIQLASGQLFTLTGRSVPGDAAKVSVTYASLPKDVMAGDTILLSDGALELVVEETTNEEVRCRVVVGGPLSSHKGVNLPGRSIRVSALTEKDRADLLFGLAQEVDYVALSFVRSAEDIRQVHEVMRSAGRRVPVIAKIEKHEALDRIDEIVDVADGIMVARGDLGVEIPLEQVPRVQKMLIAKANRAGKPVITATQMLKSMVDNPRPTRAEATDVANAILDGTDAVMLSEETAMGSHPVEAVQIMVRIAEGTETVFPFRDWPARFGEHAGLSLQEAVAHTACHLAQEIRAAAIVTCTQSGSTTRLVSKYRPSQPILALTPDETTYRRLALVWGAVPLRMKPAEDEDAMEQQAVRIARDSGLVKPRQTMVITAGLPLHVAGTTNLVRVVTME